MSDLDQLWKITLHMEWEGAKGENSERVIKSMVKRACQGLDFFPHEKSDKLFVTRNRLCLVLLLTHYQELALAGALWCELNKAPTEDLQPAGRSLRDWFWITVFRCRTYIDFRNGYEICKYKLNGICWKANLRI